MMALAGEAVQMVGGGGPVCGFVEDCAVEIEHLIRPQNEGAGPFAADFLGDSGRLQLGERIGYLVRQRALRHQAVLDGCFVDCRRGDVEIQTGVLQHGRARAAAGGQDQVRRTRAGQGRRLNHGPLRPAGPSEAGRRRRLLRDGVRGRARAA